MKTTEELRGRYALITGATSGFGYEFARLFAMNGCNLVLVARNEKKLVETASDLSQAFFVEVLPLSVDLFNPAAAKDIYETVSMKGITIDYLVNDAGQGQHGNFIEYDVERDVDMIQLNVTSLVALTKYFLKDMLARNQGRILQVSSLLGKYPTPLMTVYAATKAFVLSFTEGLIHELKDTNVTVTALLPGASDTDFFHKAGGEDSTIYREEELSDPVKVAKDGFDALLAGERKIISGLKNKIYGAMSNAMPDSALAATMEKKMKPGGDEQGRTDIGHGPSAEERENIRRATGKTVGDYDEHEDHVHNQ